MNKKLSTKKSYSVNLLDKPLFSSTISIAGPQLKPVEEIMSFDALDLSSFPNGAPRTPDAVILAMADTIAQRSLEEELGGSPSTEVRELAELFALRHAQLGCNIARVAATTETNPEWYALFLAGKLGKGKLPVEALTRVAVHLAKCTDSTSKADSLLGELARKVKQALDTDILTPDRAKVPA
ncbi:MAG: hypothetical protein A3D26_04590 [Candidatus Blackburnbacteria bacterium RIFCSPHIGHO2_02_FULL_44_20]|uniref:Uncharacterized protein n=1 Tax=Candidatus Blackburnbacteria bacterium RIFCSPHIGHO2_02_FULL_44_20 TaxID=1797516 RepID=A0A1G1V7Z4_9BACT|nr:MAG: hypothetical protein A3E16_00280 [Candidatus Blackburnbacteria bacterium RIFCSPHIGHO2_12_FULL_44_25]OGY11473.1 MAG: hypothetical protein A3D26_04590 [Candidatus Blackburnbacteria bacterium RIFCSPHIGHO2_02_FULL_44_20]